MSTTPPTADEVLKIKADLALYNKYVDEMNLPGKRDQRNRTIIALAVAGVVVFCFFLGLFIYLIYIVSTRNTENFWFPILISFIGWAVAPGLMWGVGINNAKNDVYKAEKDVDTYMQTNKIEDKQMVKSAFPELFS